jgi:hypothetical protein
VFLDDLGPWFILSGLLAFLGMWILARPPKQWPADILCIDETRRVWRVPWWYTKRTGWDLSLLCVVLLFMLLLMM